MVKALLYTTDGELVEMNIELSEAAKKDLEDLEKELELAGITKDMNVRAVDTKLWRKERDEIQKNR